MTPTEPIPTPLARESATMEALRCEVRRLDAGHKHFDCARKFETAADELARLRADVERLTAERDGAREAVEHACWLMREPMTLVEAEEARTYLTGMVVMQKKRARRALTEGAQNG